MTTIRTLRRWAHVFRSEGLAAVADRCLDRALEARAPIASALSRRPARVTVPLLNVLGVPALPRYGGVPLQLMARLRLEADERPIALLSRRSRGGLVLECRHGGRLWRRTFPGGGWNGDPLQEDAAWFEAVIASCRLVGATGVHIENLAGLSLPTLDRLLDTGWRSIVSLHDFGFFCRRPHLLESRGGFCGYSREPEQCRRCLVAGGDRHAIDQDRHRTLASRVLDGAVAMIVPSHFLGRQVAELLPLKKGPRCMVVPPGTETHAPQMLSERKPDEVAMIGGGADHKGGGCLPGIASALVRRGVAVTVYGGDGHHNLQVLRGLNGVRIRGYYRAGSLSALLARQAASVAVLLPRVPETFSLALSEAWSAGVPVVVPATGALPERLQNGGGRLVRDGASGEEVADAVDDLRARSGIAVPAPATAGQAARAHLDIYRGCGVWSP